MCNPVGIQIVLIIETIIRWVVDRADAKVAFMRIGRANRDVHVRPPRESRNKIYYWLLLAPAYVLVNWNAKWQHQCDEAMFKLGLLHLSLVYQLFNQMENGKLVIIVIKIVDDLLIAGEKEHVENFLNNFNRKLEFGWLVHASGILKFFILTIIQHDDLSCTIDGDEKLMAFKGNTLTRLRPRQLEAFLSDYEKSS